MIRDVFSVAHAIPGRVRLKLSQRSLAELRRAADRLLEVRGVTRLHVNAAARSMTVEYNSDVLDCEALLDVTLEGTPPGGRIVRLAIQERWRVGLPAQEVWALLTDLSRFEVLADAIVNACPDDPDRWSVRFAGAAEPITATVSLIERTPGSRLVFAVSGPLAVQVAVYLDPRGPEQTELRVAVVHYGDANGLADTILFSVMETQVRERLRDAVATLGFTCERDGR